MRFPFGSGDAGARERVSVAWRSQEWRFRAGDGTAGLSAGNARPRVNTACQPSTPHTRVLFSPCLLVLAAGRTLTQPASTEHTPITTGVAADTPGSPGPSAACFAALALPLYAPGALPVIRRKPQCGRARSLQRHNTARDPGKCLRKLAPRGGRMLRAHASPGIRVAVHLRLQLPLIEQNPTDWHLVDPVRVTVSRPLRCLGNRQPESIIKRALDAYGLISEGRCLVRAAVVPWGYGADRVPYRGRGGRGHAGS
jgi:hypothetical protein